MSFKLFTIEKVKTTSRRFDFLTPTVLHNVQHVKNLK